MRLISCMLLDYGALLLMISFPHTAQAQHGSYFDGIEMPRIAIVGGGIGGASAAHRLQLLFGGGVKTLDIYEGAKVGGRLRTVKVNDLEYEVGGTVIHPSNQHMTEYVKILGLQRAEDVDGNFAYFKDKEIIFESAVSSIVSTLQLVWRYGLSLFRMESHTNSFFKDFERIYEWQKEHQSFTTVPNLLLAMSDELMNATTISLREQCTTAGLSEQIIDELVLIASRVNYGQTPDNLHGLVGFVSVAGASGGLWSVKGGNYKVCEGLIKESGANLINSNVIRVTNIRADSQQPLFSVTTTDGKTTEYDVVIVANPFIKGQITTEFSGFSSDFTQYSRVFHRTFAYIIEGVPNFEYFGYSTQNAMPTQVFPIDKDSFFSSLEEVYPVTRPEKSNQRVYKVFANSELSQEQLDLLFKSRKSTQVIDWLAYPEYQPNMEFVPFVLAPRLYYVNAIEPAASAMEMSAVGGVNVANLIVHEYMGNEHLVDNMFIIEEKHIKIEL